MLLALSAGLGWISTASAASTREPERIRAEIRTTSYGVPHIRAGDFAGAGMGLGYAFAKTDICAIAERWVTVDAQRSKYFGADADAPLWPGIHSTNLQSDFFWKRILDLDVVGRELRLPPPLGPTPQVREIVRGYVMGYNRYLREVGVSGIPDARCRGKEWVRPISERDVYLRALHWNMFLSSVSLTQALVSATPPASVGANHSSSAQPSSASANVGDHLAAAAHGLNGPGSNMIALGKDATDNGRGMLFANPHWFWQGPERFFETHLTIPGRMNVYGAVLPGVPIIIIGSTQQMAWSHTLATPKRYTLYELRLAARSPTSYWYDGQVRKMTPRTVVVEARTSNGSFERKSHTFWETPNGMILENADYPWTTQTAYAFRDVGMSFRWLNQALAIDQAQSVEEVDRAGKSYLAEGWLNTMATDARGHAIFRDHTAVPHVTNAMLDRCVTSAKGKEVLRTQHVPILDGSRSECEWGSSPEAPVPGIFGSSELPKLDRTDYVTNSNDSYWLNTPRQPLEGYARILGDERQPRTLRTRMGLTKIENRLAGKDGYPGNRFSLAQLEEITFNNRVLVGEMWRDSLVALCHGTTVPPAACEALRRWDVAENATSRGAVLFRRFTEHLAPPGEELGKLGDLFTVPFDPRDPVHTPNGLNVNNPKVAQALEAAVDDLTKAHVAFDAPYGEYQFEERHDERIPIPGGNPEAGQYSPIWTAKGWSADHPAWSNVWLGSSFVMWVRFTDAGPVGHTITTYSQSSNPDSANNFDQTKLFSAGKTKPMLFDEVAIESDPSLTKQSICEQAAAACK